MCIDNQMHYNYTMINYTADNINKKDFLYSIKKRIKDNMCNNEKYFKTLKLGVDYNYFDRSRTIIGTVIIRNEDCDQ